MGCTFMLPEHKWCIRWHWRLLLTNECKQQLTWKDEIIAPFQVGNLKLVILAEFLYLALKHPINSKNRLQPDKEIYASNPNTSHAKWIGNTLLQLHQHFYFPSGFSLRPDRGGAKLTMEKKPFSPDNTQSSDCSMLADHSTVPSV